MSTGLKQNENAMLIYILPHISSLMFGIQFFFFDAGFSSMIESLVLLMY
jgi:hypothetical protein